MSRRRSGTRAVLLALVALVVAFGFLARRTLTGPGGPVEVFDPALYRDLPPVTAAEAEDLVGERAVVCGRVVNTTFASATRGQPTYLNLDRAYPDQPFDAVIWGRDRARFDPRPETAYRGARICVAGRITTYRGVPRIEVVTPAQIRVQGGA
jgi:hypothetical protein